jgi:cardiolipin synthase
MNAWFWVFVAYITLNFLVMVSMIFIERRKLTSVISWLTVVSILPGLGFLIYVLFGSGLSIRVRTMISKFKLYESTYDEELKNYFENKVTDRSTLVGEEEIIRLCHNYGSVLYPENDVKIFTNGPDKMDALLQDIESAQESINIEYYIFANDKIGRQVMDALIRKSKQGVKVQLIYDSIGCVNTPRRFFRKLKKAGGKVAEFFPPLLWFRFLNLKVNYRNHRKIVVIDGKIAYTGGINIRDDHMGQNKRRSPWRDTHLRIVGTGVYSLQNVFLNDWRYVKKEKTNPNDYIEQGLFKKTENDGNVYMQLITSGPNEEVKPIKEVYLKLILSAKKEIVIQTPYFVPDDTLMEALRIALQSGVKVKIMIPRKADHISVYWVTLSYLKDIVGFGADVYIYDGFLHSKALIVDDNKLSIGTCNFDNRSFNLNFEDTVLMYSEQLTAQYRACFEEDVKRSQVADYLFFKKKRWLTRFLQSIFRLFSPIF